MKDKLADLRVALREVNSELRRTSCALTRLGLKAERAELRKLIRAERDRRAA